MDSANKIRILNVMTGIADGGLEMVVYRIYKGLNKNKYELCVCTLLKAEKGFLLENFKNECTNIYSLNFRNKNLRIRDYFRNLYQFIKLIRLIGKGKFDIVHSHDYFAAVVARLAVLINKITFHKKPLKIYTTYHNIYFWLGKISHFVNRILSVITDKIICVSESVRDYAMKKEKISKNKFIVIYNGLNQEEFYVDNNLRQSQRKILEYREDDFVICNIGVYSVRKGQIYLLKAFRKVLEKHNNLKLALVGSIREHELDIYNEMLEFVKKNKMQDKVAFVNTMKEVNGIYNMMDLFVMPSVTEGFGLVAYEAMLAEKICIVSDIAPFQELIKDGINGFLFKSKNPDSLAEKLDYVIKNIDKLEYMRKAAKEFVRSKLSVREMISKYHALYDIS